MSHHVNLSGRELLTAHQNVLNANGIDWALFSYGSGTNDLKVQSTGDGGLEELEGEFSDGRIQYAFVRVTEPTSQLPKFVQINWCGEGVPVLKKGLFHIHSAAVANFLKGTHVVISARSQDDVLPSVIMSRVEAASGSKYSIHQEPARKAEPIGPVGTNYTPVGKVDINALRKEAAVRPPTQSQSTATRPIGVGKSWSKPVPTGYQHSYTPPPPAKPSAIPDDDWDPAPAPIKPTHAPPLPTASRPTPSAPAIVKEAPKPAITPSKPAEEDRIGPVGTNWEPVQLPKPKKLVNPFEKRAQEEQQAKPPIKKSGMTWSERQALAKKQADEDEARSRASSFKPTPAAAGLTPKWKAPAAVGFGVGAGVATGVGVSAFMSKDNEEPEEEAEWEAPAPPAAPPPPPAATRPPPPRQSEPEPEPEQEPEPEMELEPEPEPEPEVAPPPPPPPPPPAPVSQMAGLRVQEPEPEFVPPPPPPPPPAPSEGASKKGKGVCAIVLYEYEATEENEMHLLEGELIEEIEKLDEGWWTGVGDNGTKQGLFPANYVEEIAQADEPEQEPEPEPEVAPPPPPPPPPPAAREPSPEPQDQGVTAIALYDYEAAEENEISFHEGERIVEIETVSEDWWQGKTAGGNVGLFPALYVEVQ